MSEFSSKVIILTAAYGNIMKATAKAFAKQGAILSINGRNAEKLSKAAQEYKEAGAKEVLTIQADIGKTENIDKIINETVDKFGKIDVLVICVGGSSGSTLHTFTSEGFDYVFNLHVKAPALLIQKAAPHLEKTKGNIINVGGASSEIHTLSYVFIGSISAAARNKLTKMSALELAPKGIRVNSVNPGFCEASDDMNVQFRQMLEAEAPKHPLGHELIKFDEVAASILFLASEKANVITGEILRVDRGRVLTGQ